MQIPSDSDLIDNIELDMRFERATLGSDEPESHLHYLFGDILLTNFDDETTDGEEEKVTIIGGFQLLLIDGDSARSNGISLDLVYDLNDEAWQFFEGAYNTEKLIYNENIKKVLGEEIKLSRDKVLIIDRIGILPEYRGRNLGLLVLHNIIERYSLGASVIAINPAPFEFNSSHIDHGSIRWDDKDSSPDNTKKLGDYYKKVGFKRVADTPYMVLSTEQKLPKIQMEHRNEKDR